MNTARPVVAMRERHRTPGAPGEEAPAQESLSAHAGRVLRARLSAMACGVLDPCIAMLRGLRQRAGGAPDSDAEATDDGVRARNHRSGTGHHDAALPDEAEAPRPRRRLLVWLISFSVFLAGGMGGGALAYELLAKLLQRQSTENGRLTMALSKQSKSVASNQRKLDEALAKRAEAEKKLEEAQAKRNEAEKRLEASLNDAKMAAEKQKKLDEAVKLLESIRAADRAGIAALPRSVGADGKSGARKSGDCTLVTGNVQALKDCVANFNR